MLNVLYILEALRHNNIMPGLLPGWTKKDIEQLPDCFLRLRVEILNVLYILDLHFVLFPIRFVQNNNSPRIILLKNGLYGEKYYL